MKFKDYLLFREASFTDEDIPQRFYVALSVKRLNWDDLEQGVLKGVAGISEKSSILGTFFGQNAYGFPRDGGVGIGLMMPGVETVRANKLSRFMYENPNYWSHKGFSLMNRKSHYEGVTGGWVLLNKIMPALPYEKEKMAARKPIEAEINSGDFNNVGQFIKHVKRVLKKYNVPHDPEMLDEFIPSMMSQMAGHNNDESEWAVKDKMLRVPPGSVLLYSDNCPNCDQEIKARPGLQTKYKIQPIHRRKPDWEGQDPSWDFGDVPQQSGNYHVDMRYLKPDDWKHPSSKAYTPQEDEEKKKNYWNWLASKGYNRVHHRDALSLPS